MTPLEQVREKLAQKVAEYDFIRGVLRTEPPLIEELSVRALEAILAKEGVAGSSEREYSQGWITGYNVALSEVHAVIASALAGGGE